jgi:nucleoside triphosphate pyrophosphatase
MSDHGEAAPPLVLASASPRRVELLRRICAEFRVLPSGLEEVLEEGSVGPAVARLAAAKARAVAERVGTGIVLGADTVVVIDGEALGKPGDRRAAVSMLRRLRGRAHEVITGVAVVDAASGRSEATAVVTRVVMAAVSDAEIDVYVATGEPFDKAGGYGIQGHGAALVAGWVGSYSNVVGLPLAATAALLTASGVPVTSSPEDSDRRPRA